VRLPTFEGLGVLTGMKRPLSLVVGAAVAALLIAAIGASAHSAGPLLTRITGAHSTRFGSEASGPRESPEPSDSPEPSNSPKASPSPEPTEKPEPTDKPEASPSPEPTEKPDADETDNHPTASPSPEPSGGGDGEGGGGGHGD
jgi:outer membrane biosynthesis protein TonB